VERAPAVETPRMRRQLRWLAALAGFVVCIIVIAFIGAFRNQGANSHVPTQVRINTSHLVENGVMSTSVETNVTIAGQPYRRVPLLVARTRGVVHVWWSHSTRNGCLLESRLPVAEGEWRFIEMCGDGSWAIDGTCVHGCSRDLDQFGVTERGGISYAELTNLIRGAAAQPT
jgi:hypothetical protein